MTHCLVFSCLLSPLYLDFLTCWPTPVSILAHSFLLSFCDPLSCIFLFILHLLNFLTNWPNSGINSDSFLSFSDLHCLVFCHLDCISSLPRMSWTLILTLASVLTSCSVCYCLMSCHLVDSASFLCLDFLTRWPNSLALAFTLSLIHSFHISTIPSCWLCISPLAHTLT